MPKRAPRPGKRRPPDLSQPLEQWTLEVHRPDDGQRLDAFVASRLRWRSRSSVQQLIREGRVFRLGRPGRPGERVHAGDRVMLAIARPDDVHPDPAAIPVEVLYEDEWLLACNKQPGVLVHPVGPHRTNTLIAALHLRYRDAGDADRVPKLCHRLDQDTSGVWVVALDDRARTQLGEDFAKRRVQKSYLALVHGEVAEDAFSIRLAIGRDFDSPVRLKRRAGPGRDALRARTDVRVVERFRGATAVACEPRTGRTHQIRVHLAAVGHPILCDPLYGPEAHPDRWTEEHHGADPLRDHAGEIVLDRQALHAARLEITHPMTGKPLHLEAPLPADMERCAESLRAERVALPGTLPAP